MRGILFVQMEIDIKMKMKKEVKLDGVKDVLSHLDTLTLLDLSGNSLGKRATTNLAKFVAATRSSNYLKLARCSLSATQLDRVFRAALRNRSGFELGADHLPTHAEVVLHTNLLCLSLNLTDNALGGKGAEVLCAAFNKRPTRENYTLVSLNLALCRCRMTTIVKYWICK